MNNAILFKNNCNFFSYKDAYKHGYSHARMGLPINTNHFYTTYFRKLYNKGWNDYHRDKEGIKGFIATAFNLLKREE